MRGREGQNKDKRYERRVEYASVVIGRENERRKRVAQISSNTRIGEEDVDNNTVSTQILNGESYENTQIKTFSVSYKSEIATRSKFEEM